MYLGIDIGTSGVKTVLVDGEQRVVASETVALEVQRPHPGQSEQDPESWVTATIATIDELARDHPKEIAAVTGIGLSGQMHGATLLGSDHKPLRPCILWNDGRSAAECAELEERWPALRAVTGNKAMPGFTAPKLVWVATTSRTFSCAPARFCYRRPMCAWYLTGEAIEDMSDAAGTLWLDVARRDWSDEGLAATGLSRDAMPRLVEGSAARRNAATGVRRALGHDEAASRRGRRGRQCRRRRRPGRHPAGIGLRLARHVGRAVGDHGPFRTESGPRRPRLLPRRARHLAPDGRHPLGRLLPLLGLGDLRPQGGRAACPARRQAPGTLAGGLPALPFGRAHPA